MTTTLSIQDRVLICLERSGLDKQGVDEFSYLADDIGMDSLDRLNFAIELEDEFHVEFNDATIESLDTVGEVITYINTHMMD